MRLHSGGDPNTYSFRHPPWGSSSATKVRARDNYDGCDDGCSSFVVIQSTTTAPTTESYKLPLFRVFLRDIGTKKKKGLLALKLLLLFLFF